MEKSCQPGCLETHCGILKDVLDHIEETKGCIDCQRLNEILEKAYDEEKAKNFLMMKCTRIYD